MLRYSDETDWDWAELKGQEDVCTVLYVTNRCGDGLIIKRLCLSLIIQCTVFLSSVCALHDAFLQTGGVLASNFMFKRNNINVALGMWFGVLQWRCFELYVPTTRCLYTGRTLPYFSISYTEIPESVLLFMVRVSLCYGAVRISDCIAPIVRWLVDAELEVDWKQSAVT
jgi:hypothetical protein